MNRRVINVDETSPEFMLDLERRIKLAKNPKNRIPLHITRKDILKKISGTCWYKNISQLDI